jgi:IclR family transcriptional regulator, acetate operon repressor
VPETNGAGGRDAGQESESGGHRAAKRALELIEHVAAAPEPVGLSELARQVGLPKSSAHALARTLDDEGFLERDDKGAYQLGPRLLRLVLQLGHRFELPRVARPIMEELVTEIGETAILGVRHGSGIVYVEQIEAPQYIRYAAPMGEPRPLHNTSIGKVHLAAMPLEEARALLRELKLERTTQHTKVAVNAIMSELSTIRVQGYATNREESVAGVAAVAVPVFEGGAPGGALIAGLSMAGPAERLRDRLDGLAPRLTHAAEQIGAGAKLG